MSPSRRIVLMGVGAGGLAAGAAAAAPASRPGSAEDPAEDQARLHAMLERYDGFGSKASGGPGDEACGAWLEETLTGWGYACRRQPFNVPWFEARQAALTSGDATAPVIPQAIVVTTGATGVTAPLRLASGHGDLTGAIAMLVLPYKRWAALADPQVAKPLADAFARGAVAAILVTAGPTGEAVALNVTTHKPGFERPVAILAPRDAKAFIAAAELGRPGTLVVDGQGGQRNAFNLIARLDRKAARTLILSTPRSGWFRCAAERGSGLAVWLSLARWLARGQQGVNIELLATSGHEYEYLGGEHYLAQARRRRSPAYGCMSAPAPRPGTGMNSARCCALCRARTASAFSPPPPISWPPCAPPSKASQDWKPPMSPTGPPLAASSSMSSTPATRPLSASMAGTAISTRKATICAASRPASSPR